MFQWLREMWRRLASNFYFAPMAAREGQAVNQLYLKVVEQARQPSFYMRGKVADTLDGRFDMIALHVFLVMHRLKNEGKETNSFTQQLFDEMFADMDRGLREMGASDVGVGKRVRAMGKAFMGRVEAYDLAIDNRTDLEDALVRNLYRGVSPGVEALSFITHYVVATRQRLLQQDVNTILGGQVGFETAERGGEND